MEKKENQRITLTKRLLKESLLRLMSKKNIQNITVSELCEDAGINRSTFYNHYGCPTDVLTEIENGVVADLEQICAKDNSEQNWSLSKRTETLCDYLSEHRDLFKLLFRNNNADSEFALLLFHASVVRSTYEQVFSDIKDSDSKELMITFLTSGAYYMVRQWLLEDIPKTPKEMGELVFQLATHGWEKLPEYHHSNPQ
ncbi:MAG: TetR/AcrR family transcriptional regulator [Lachnospiraceae bacterium]